MSEPQKSAPAKATPAKATSEPKTPKKINYDTIQEDLQARLKKSGTQISENIKEKLFEEEVTRRTDLVLKGYLKVGELEQSLTKVKPDVIEYSEADANTPTKKAFSAQKNAERQKIQKKIQNFRNAINTALDQGNYKQLEDLLKSGGEEPKPDAE